MIKKRKSYKTFTKEFKLEVVRLMLESDKPSSQIALELCIHRNQLYKWKDQLEKHGDLAFKKNYWPTTLRATKRVGFLATRKSKSQRRGRNLKKAATYFAKELK